MMLTNTKSIFSDNGNLSRDFLQSLACERFLNDPRYRNGHLHILAPAPGTEVVGIHTPELKMVAHEIVKTDRWRDVIHSFSTHNPLKGEDGLLHEERMIWGLIIDYAKCQLDERCQLIDNFISAIDNWAICDNFCCNSKWAQREDKEALWKYLVKLFHSGEQWSIRVATVLSMCHFLDSERLTQTFNEIESIGFHEDEPYYVKMGIAWLLTTALAKHEDATRTFVRRGTLPNDIVKLYVRKARESRITKNIPWR